MDEQIIGADGCRYTVDSAEHRAYVLRWDAAYLRVHQRQLRMNTEFIRRMPGLDERVRADANQTAFLARQLLFVRGTIERRLYEQLRMRELVDTEMHPRGAMSFATQQLDMTGEAKITHDLSGDDPRADVALDEDLEKYVNVRGSYGFTVQDLEFAAFSGSPLPAWKAEACLDMILRGVDRVGRIGDAASGLTGFFNNALVQVVTLTNGEWLTATADEIVADVNQWEQAIISTSRNTVRRKGHKLLLPTAYEGRLVSLQRSSGSDLTVAEYILKNARLISSIESYVALDDATGTETGVSDDPMGILYLKDVKSIFWPMSIVYEEQPPQIDGWEWIVRARARVSGVQVRRPFDMAYGENLD